MSIKERIILILLSIAAIVNAISSPIFNYAGEGGLFPESYIVFEDVWEIIRLNSEMGGNTEHLMLHPVVPFTLVCFFTALIMLIGSLVGKRSIFKFGCGFGITVLCPLLIWCFFVYAIGDGNPFSKMFGISNGGMAYGLWIAIALLITSYTVALNFSKKTQQIRKANLEYKSRDLSTL